MSLTFN